MFPRTLAVIGILLSLFGVVVVPGILKRRSQRSPYPLHRIGPDEGDVPWDLSGFAPTGWHDSRGPVVKREWGWSPRFERVK